MMNGIMHIRCALANCKDRPQCKAGRPMHPLLPEERNVRQRPNGSFYSLEYAGPITIGNNCRPASDAAA